MERLRFEALDEVSRDPSAYPQTVRLITDKLFDIAASATDDFAVGVAASARNLAILGLLVMMAAILWPRIAAGCRAMTARFRPTASTARAASEDPCDC